MSRAVEMSQFHHRASSRSRKLPICGTATARSRRKTSRSFEKAPVLHPGHEPSGTRTTAR